VISNIQQPSPHFSKKPSTALVSLKPSKLANSHDGKDIDSPFAIFGQTVF
jgi:hypothetical protein